MLKRWKIVAVSTVVLVGVILLLKPWDDTRNDIGKTAVTADSVDQSRNSTVESDDNPGTDTAAAIRSRLYGELELLRGVHGEAEGQAAIEKMLAWIAQSPGEETVAAIIAVLESGENAFAFGRFAPGADGFLKSHPGFRTALLDALERLDAKAAVEFGKQLLNQSENPDEWALALRTLSRHAARTDREFLESKIKELLVKETWLNEPGFSFLQAFDAAVAEGSPSTLRQLIKLRDEPPNRAVAHAATISLDRYFQLHAGTATAILADNPELLESSGGFRASLMARANPASSKDMEAVGSYLDNLSVPQEERQTFFQSFPNFNSTFSYNLVTGSLLLTREEMHQRSLQALSYLNRWLEEGRYPELKDEMAAARMRLANLWKVQL